MAPMTRSRADADGVPTQMMLDYYKQRASAGLIITEGTQPSENGKGYCRTPGINTQQQIDAWAQITDSVAKAGGNMVMQLMHCGRVASVHNKQAGAKTVAPSPIQAKGQMYTDSHGMVDFDVPCALATDEVASVVAEYAEASKNAVAAGMSGVELHCTSGYLPAQFLSTGTNQRDDQYGGNLENRLRFVLESLEAMSGAIGADRIGIRICPGNPFNDLSDENPQQTFEALLQAIAPMNLAYVHVIRMPKGPVDNLALVANNFSGNVIVNDSYSSQEAQQVVADGAAQAVSFGRDFIGNPNLVEVMQKGEEVKGFDHKTLYTPGAEGYSDYR